MMSTFLRRLMPWTGATLLLVAISAPGLAQEKKYKPFVVTTPDGVTIAAQEWGNASGHEILFIHGFSQASLSWQRQVESDLAKEFRMITYDLRGHGNSDKPLQPAKYQESKAWADEVQAVIERAKLKRPVLVGWSYGGRVIGDYLTIHGAAGLAGLNYVGFVSKSDPSFFGDALTVPPPMFSEDLASNIAATRSFLHNCFEKQPSQDDFETSRLQHDGPAQGARKHGPGHAQHGRDLESLESSGAGDPGSGGQVRPGRCGQAHCRSYFGRQTLGLSRGRPRAVLGGYGALQYRAYSLCADGQQDRASHTYGRATVATVNMIARTDTRAFRCCPCARAATTQKMVAPEMERQAPIATRRSFFLWR
jgi:pimeloyl-ACP methyl ester carboxylesterase